MNKKLKLSEAGCAAFITVGNRLHQVLISSKELKELLVYWACAQGKEEIPVHADPQGGIEVASDSSQTTKAPLASEVE